MLRLVLDTNVWLDWLVFDDPAIAPVKATVVEGRAAVFIDDALLELDQQATRPLPFRIVTPLAFAADNLVTRLG